MKILILFFSLFTILETFAADEIGNVTFLKGRVWAARAGEKISLSKDSALFKSDEIITETGSFIKILFKDESIFSLGPNSHLQLKEYSQRQQARKPSVFELTHGFLRAKFKKQGTNSKINTSHISMGIRGTELVVESFKEKKELNSRVALLSGKIEVSPRNGDQSKRFFLKPGFSIGSRDFQTPNPSKQVKKLSKRKLKKLNSRRAPFLFEVEKRGRAFPRYQTPNRLKSLKINRESFSRKKSAGAREKRSRRQERQGMRQQNRGSSQSRLKSKANSNRNKRERRRRRKEKEKPHPPQN